MKTILNCVLAASALSGSPTEVWVERDSYVMGTILHVEIGAHDREQAIAAAEAVIAEVQRVESVVSSWSGEAELGGLNNAGVGIEHTLSIELAGVLEEVFEWRSVTGGAFDPAVGALIDAWDLRGAGRRPDASELGAALRAVGTHHYTLDADRLLLRKRAEAAWLDSGAFGKGLALRAAGRVLRERGIENAMLDFGGQLVVLGESASEGGAWEIGIAHPSNRETPVGSVTLRSGSISTSSQSERFVEVEGEGYGHILDPRTGSAVAAWGSATVVAADAMVADILSTALFVMGPEEGLAWASRREDFGVLFIAEGEKGPVATWNAAFESLTTDLIIDPEPVF